MAKDASAFQKDPDNMAAALQGRPDVTHRFDTMAGEMLGVAEGAGAFARDAIHSGLQEAVSRFFELPNTQHSPDKQHEPDKGGMER
jgi:hypothetical protein